jgi:rhodanese-related sulfurtransferase
MNKSKSLPMLALLLFSIGYAKAQTPQLLDANSFEKKMTATENKIILDVRTAGEYKEGHISDATLLDYYKADFKQQAAKLDKSKPVFVYCKAGGRSEAAVEILTDLGFKQVYDLNGGMNAWMKYNKPIVK